jgi:N-acetylneuraminate lyase
VTSARLGVKYVSPDTNDWFLSVNAFNSTYALLFAPEPKLQSFALGFGRGTVLAEDFYAPTYIRFATLAVSCCVYSQIMCNLL